MRMMDSNKVAVVDEAVNCQRMCGRLENFFEKRRLFMFSKTFKNLKNPNFRFFLGF